MAGEGPVSEFFLDENRHLVLRQAEDMCVGVMNGVCGGEGVLLTRGYVCGCEEAGGEVLLGLRICVWV